MPGNHCTQLNVFIDMKKLMLSIAAICAIAICQLPKYNGQVKHPTLKGQNQNRLPSGKNY
jgi:hypothetical protein